MTDNGLMLGDNDEVVTTGLRRIYAAPAGGAYWEGLEARIMARIAEVDLGWWTEFDRWRRPAMLAAATLMVAAGIVMYRARQADAVLLYGDLMTTPTRDSVSTDVAPQGPREATLRSMLHGRQ